MLQAIPVTLKIEGGGKVQMLETTADIRHWLPGDIVYDDQVTVPSLPPGEYRLSIGILDMQAKKPKIKLAIAGIDEDGWYPLGPIKIEAE